MTIDLNAERNFSNNLSENFLVDGNDYSTLNINEYGNFGMSTILIKTAFTGGTGIVNKNFKNFREHRMVVANRLAAENGVSTANRDEDGFPQGYKKSPKSFGYLIPGSLHWRQSGKKVSFDPIKSTPCPIGILNIQDSPK